MIFLILKMFVYLMLAVVAGGGAGWILRHLAAGKQEEEMQRTLADARARVPQFESLIRSRDEQISRLKDELKDKDVRINGLVDDVREAENALRDKDRELKQFKARHETLEISETAGEADQVMLMGDGSTTTTDTPVGDDVLEFSQNEASDSMDADRLLGEIGRLERELIGARAEAADATAEAAVTEAEVITLKAELERESASAGGGTSGQEIAELEAQLRQKTLEHDRLRQELETEQRRVLELERERELQNKSLQVLHQQLELARERNQRVANG